jgi:hypothetical protein
MDETRLTIIGMIAAFITASVTPILTESVKNYYQHKHRLQSLRIALYKEMYNNYFILRDFDVSKQDVNSAISFIVNLRQHGIRQECYKHALQNELPLFYELTESQLINALQGLMIGVTFSLPDLELATKESLEEAVANFSKYSATYKEGYSYAYYKNNFDRKILKSFVESKRYEQVLQDGEAVNKRASK